MQLVALIVAATVFIASVLSSNPQTKNLIKPETDPDKPQETEVPLPSLEPSPITEPATSATPSASPKLPASPTPSPKLNQNQPGSVYIFPSSTIISQNPNHLTLTTATDPDTVTSWYQDKLSSLGFNISASKTSVNGQVNNQLVGANEKQKVTIQITNPNQTQIKVSY